MADIYDPLVKDQTYLNEIKYAARDFASIADDLLRRLKIVYEEVYNDYASTSQGIMLRDLVAWAYSALTWYLDRTASDCFLSTARTRAAVERLVEQIAYKMGAASSSSGSVVLTFPNGTPAAFDLKDRWKYSGTNGLYYESFAKFIQATPLAPGASITVDIRQGETRTLTYTANGQKNQTYRLSSIDETRYLGKKNIEVWVDGSLWDEKDFLLFEPSNHYEVSYLANPPLVRFGDGIAGNIPPVGSEVKIRFLICDGEKGNAKSDVIKTSVDTLTIAGQPVTFTVTNPDRTSGGNDPELIAKAKKWAPVSFASRGAAIIRADYEAIANTFQSPFGSVAKAYAINPRSSYHDIVFSDQVSEIKGLLVAFDSEVSALENLINQKVASLLAETSATSATVASIEALRGQLYGWSEGVRNGVVSARATTVDSLSRTDLAISQMNTVKNLLQTLIDYVTEFGPPLKADLLEELSEILVYSTGAQSESVGARSSISATQGALDTVISPLDELRDATVDGGTLAVLDSEMAASVSTIESLAADIASSLSNIDGKGEALAIAIGDTLVDMEDRMTTLFSDDCLSNYVQVPILTLDLSGNYAAPSIGLRNALQVELNGKKEVTQVVEVVDGTPSLVPAVIEVTLSVTESYVPSEVKSQVEATLVGMLKGRDFNSPLYLSDLYNAVKNSSPGIYYANIIIVGPAEFKVGENLVPPENRIIVLGSISVEVI